MYDDTITAISTPLGEGGIGLVRLSGPRCRDIVERIFTGRLSNRKLAYGHVVDPDTSAIVDEVLVAYMRAPHTYTREDVVEINCHGGPLPTQQVLALTMRHGARLAGPGEFTLRAFLNGRLDLAQAESVLDVVRAQTTEGLRLAVAGLQGRLSNQVRQLRQEIVQVMAYLTARIDFPEDDVEERDVRPELTAVATRLEELLAEADAGMIYRQGVRTAIVGRPNVGKSSLLNMLLRESRAIVTPFPGTTRDTVEESINIRGVSFLLADTAGMAASDNPIEQLGIERSRAALLTADLVLFVVDGNVVWTDEDAQIASLLGEQTVLTIVNKLDLPRKLDLTVLRLPHVSVSAATGAGLAELEQTMCDAVLKGRARPGQDPRVSNPRHKEALAQTLRYVRGALGTIDVGAPDDLVTVDLTAALDALGEITGEVVGDEILETIFRDFCIGK
ncbi:MAG: tRNA uridine-5-carboxymethylaminomethyl(34) synthesis GTPase MnmE [Chloroflexota bacterium]|nr:MAG: tRNA uridine-5-carboxymethylaminomethyl(34) synthesis GTPase MnmE [Chloroflexota bacterium]